MHLVHLDEPGIRELMISEVDLDRRRHALYVSPRLTSDGRRAYPELLLRAARFGTVASLARDVRPYLAELEAANGPSGRAYQRRVPLTAAETLAEGEMNRFYCRAVCLDALARGLQNVIVYRAKPVSTPRSDSERKVGQRVSAAALLGDLRVRVGVELALGVPAGPNSGLSVRVEHEAAA